MLAKAIYGQKNLGSITLIENCIEAAQNASYLESGKSRINKGDNALDIRNILGTYSTKENTLRVRIVNMEGEETIISKILTSEEEAAWDKGKGISIYNFIGTDVKKLGMRITEIKETKKLTEIINKDKEALTEEEKKFLEENLPALLNNAKEEALKEKNYALLIRLTCEEMRRKLKDQRGNIESHANSNMYDDAATRKAMDKKMSDYQKSIRENEALQKAARKEVKANEKYYKELNAYIAARKAGKEYVLKEIDKAIRAGKSNKEILTYCNLYVEIELAERHEIIIPANGKEGKTANQIYDYVSKSEEWGQIERISGALDHTTAQQMAAEDYVVLAIYKNTSGGHGHVVFVTRDNKYLDTYGVVEINGLNTVDPKRQEVRTERFSKQFASYPVVKGTQFFYYKTKVN
jgi:hypothetical protein